MRKFPLVGTRHCYTGVALPIRRRPISHGVFAVFVLSSNVISGADRARDPGVTAWFSWDGAQYRIPVDPYETPVANLQAIYHVRGARRAELCCGTSALVRATIAGFEALPAPLDTKTSRELLGVAATERNMGAVRAAYKRLASTAHPDKGGSHATMTELNAALATAEREMQP